MSKRFLVIIIYFISLLIISCSQMTGSAYDRFYYQQQSDPDKDGGILGGTTDWEDDDSDTTVPELEAGQISMFSAIQKDGYILGDAKAQVLGKLAAGDGYEHDTSAYDTKKLIAKFSGANVPEMSYSGTVDWVDVTDTSWESYKGANSSAGSNSITDMVYLRSVGINPFFASNSSYNTNTYRLYDEETESSSEETFMKRFHFLRFTGKGGGVAALDNYLVAVDTYTNLVFSFAKPTKWGSLLGNAVPLEWGPVDLVSTGPGGKKFKFYEYDPAGYVGQDGKFYMSQSYKDNLAAANYDPSFTGQSPYLGTVGAGGSVGETGYPVSGSLQVKAKYIKNVSMTDSWGDHGNADGTDKPEFIYDIRSRAYTGFEAGEWHSLSSYKPGDASILPNKAKHIEIGKTLSLGGAKNYDFTEIVGGLTLELDSRLIEIDITGNDSITDYETPIIFLTYDRYAQKWKPTIDNDTYLIIPPEYNKDFELGLGESKDFVITLPTGFGQEMEICYELTWTIDQSENQGIIYSAQLENKCDDYEFSGNNGKYDINYVDFSEESAQESKIIELELIMGNLEYWSPLIINKSINNDTSGFISSVEFGENNMDSGIISSENNILPIIIELSNNQSLNQTGTITLTLNDESDSKPYDTTNSPKEFVINVNRKAYVSIYKASFNIDNVKLKNINLFDVGGDQPAGGYEEPEFSWNIKTKHNTDAWKELSNNADNNVIAFDKTAKITGTTDYAIESPRDGEHIISLSAEIWERDNLAGNDHDYIMKHNKPEIQFKYIPFTDSWELTGATSFAYNDGNDNTWKIKKIAMNKLKRGETQTVTVSLSAYINDVIWPAGGEGGGFLGWVTDVINGPTTAGWGDMELTFDVSWKEYL